MRGISCARVNSARSRSPASNCTGSISARPSRPLRRASQASGLSASSTVTSLPPVPSRIWRRPSSRCRARSGSMPAPLASVRAFTVRTRSWLHRGAEPAAQRAAGMLERAQHGIDGGIVRRPRSTGRRARRWCGRGRSAADLAVAQAERDMGEIHRALAREGDVGERRGAARSSSPTGTRTPPRSRAPRRTTRDAVRRPGPRRPPRSPAQPRRTAAASLGAGPAVSSRGGPTRAGRRAPGYYRNGGRIAVIHGDSSRTLCLDDRRS